MACAWWPVEIRGQALRQLLAVWTLFVVVAGVCMVPPVLFGLVTDELNLSKAQLSSLPATFLLTKGVCALPCGEALHRFGCRPCIVCGCVGLGLAGAAYTMAASLRSLIILHAAYGLLFSLSGLAPLILFVNSWFERDKSAAIGFLVSGFSIAGVVWPSATAAVAAFAGWRSAAAGLPLAVALLALPLSVALRDGPHAMGRRAATAAHAAAPSALPWFLFDRAVWHMAMMAAETLFVVNSLINFLVLCTPRPAPEFKTREPHLRAGRLCERRHHARAASACACGCAQTSCGARLCPDLTQDARLPLALSGVYSSLVFALSIAGKLIFGVLLDSSRAPLFGFAGCLTFAAGGASVLSLDRDEAGRLRLVPASSNAQLLVFALLCTAPPDAHPSEQPTARAKCAHRRACSLAPAPCDNRRRRLRSYIHPVPIEGSSALRAAARLQPVAELPDFVAVRRLVPWRHGHRCLARRDGQLCGAFRALPAARPRDVHAQRVR